MAADGIATRPGSTSYACKMEVGRHVAIATSGYARWFNSAGELTYDFQNVAKRIVARAHGVYEAMDLLLAETLVAHAALPPILKRRSPDTYESMLVESAKGVDRGTIVAFLLAGLQWNEVMMATLFLDFELPTEPSPLDQMVPWQRVKYCPPDCPEDGVPFAQGYRNGIDAALPRARLSAGKDLPKLAADLLEAQTAASPATVGPPYAMVQVTTKGIVWLQRPGICH